MLLVSYIYASPLILHLSQANYLILWLHQFVLNEVATCLIRFSPPPFFRVQGAFRKKALEFHPDHNQNNSGNYCFKEPLFFYNFRWGKQLCHLLFFNNFNYYIIEVITFVRQLKCLFLDTEMAEAKFKEVVASYEAIQLERKQRAC